MFLEKLEQALASKKSFLADPLNYVGFGVSGVLNIIHWTWLYFKIPPGTSKILLHYNVVSGPDLIDIATRIYFIPLLALIILILNLYVASVFYKKEKLSSYFIAIATIAVQLIFLAASLILIMVNG